MNAIKIVYSHLLVDMSRLSGVPLRAPSDLNMSWILKEGPALDKELLQYLEGLANWPSFPEWLSPLAEAFRSSDRGDLLRYLRQCLLFGYKLEFEPTNEQLKEACASFVETDRSIGIWNEVFQKETENHNPFYRLVRSYVSRVTAKCNFLDIIPSHGPGAVYPRKDPSVKALMSSIYVSIQEYYDYWEYMNLPFEDLNTILSRDVLEIDRITCNLTFVPKDSRGPRIICVHPAEAIWIQQGQRAVLERAITNALGHRINFRDQGLNSGMALKASIDREYCTLDLKDASDRISLKLVEYTFGWNSRYLMAARAHFVHLPGGRIVRLEKFAPMGNCLTFPVQSLLFYAIVRAGIMCQYGENCTDIYVFGDDIIFPSKYHSGVVRALTRCGLVTNSGKTFHRGFFRESCGVDAYHGVDVTPLRWKRWDVSSFPDSISMCALAKNLRLRGYEETASALYHMIGRRYGTLPISNNPNGSGIYEYADVDFGYLLRNSIVRYDKKLHKWVTPILRGVAVLDSNISHDRRHVLESILRLTRMGVAEFGQSEPGYAVPHRLREQRGWLDVIWK
jgi:hypothetical protein